MYYTFLSNMEHEGLAPFVVPLPLTSTSAATLLGLQGLQADLIHLDAAHDYHDVADDIRAWWPLLRPGGVLFGDDFDPGTWPGVVKAVMEFSDQEGLMIRLAGGRAIKWWIEKPLGVHTVT